MSYDIWWTFRGYAEARAIHRRGELFKFLMYALFACGVPLLMTIGLFVLNLFQKEMKSWPWIVTPHVPEFGCFLEGGVKLYYLYIPKLILIICNWIFYLMTAFNIWRLSRSTAVLDSAAAGNPQAHRTHRHRFMVYLKLSVVMGLYWVLEIVSFLYPGFTIRWIFDFFNNGILKLELPNMYNRWTSVPIANYCVDYRIMVEPELIKPRFWAQLPEYIDTKFETYLRMGGLRSSKVSTNSSARGYNSLEDSIQVGKKKFSLQQSATTVLATLVSCFFLLLVLVVYFLLPELQNLCGLILMAYVFSLLMAFLLLFVIQIQIRTSNACIGLTMSIYFFFLAAFCWMSVMSYDVWWTFRGLARARTIHQRGDFFKFLMYSLFAFGVPLLMTIGLFVLNANRYNMRALPWFVIPHVPEYGCFLEYGAALYYLYIPGLILILCNWIFCVMTAIYIRRLIRGVMLDSVAAANPQAHYMHTLRFLAYLKLWLVVGFCWLLEIANVLYSGNELFWIIDVTSIIIALTTFLIFVCKKEILKKLCIRYLGKVAMRWYPPLKSYSTSMNQGSNQEPATLQSKVSSQPNKLSKEYAMAPISVKD
ncbi:hypothetical protein PYW08_004645 [Mythimna loreyi]|uniref:Uncharacterized protein n=1 Tax=Mythimna loreyi TaxID=667449 RepID=A0ACC2QQ11_9NEOP|nr:hypothetical protein PYW08_004645 [Mythimna loreyi]